MTIQNGNATANGQVALTQMELDYLENFIKAGDRTGFYMAYYNMTGSQGAILQAKVSSFSDTFGGLAFVSNAVLQVAFGENPPPGQRGADTLASASCLCRG